MNTKRKLYQYDDYALVHTHAWVKSIRADLALPLEEEMVKRGLSPINPNEVDKEEIRVMCFSDRNLNKWKKKIERKNKTDEFSVQVLDEVKRRQSISYYNPAHRIYSRSNSS